MCILLHSVNSVMPKQLLSPPRLSASYYQYFPTFIPFAACVLSEEDYLNRPSFFFKRHHLNILFANETHPPLTYLSLDSLLRISRLIAVGMAVIKKPNTHISYRLTEIAGS